MFISMSGSIATSDHRTKTPSHQQNTGKSESTSSSKVQNSYNAYHKGLYMVSSHNDTVQISDAARQKATEAPSKKSSGDKGSTDKVANDVKSGLNAAWQFVQGVGSAIDTLPATGDQSKAYETGRVVGDTAAVVGSAVATAAGVAISGGGDVVSATGVGALVGVPAAVAGAAVATGGSVMLVKSYDNFNQDTRQLSQRDEGTQTTKDTGKATSADTTKKTAGTGKPTVQDNKAKGDKYENEVAADMSQNTHSNVKQQITVKTQSGVKTRLDIIGTNKNSGKLDIVETKSSSTAPLTKNQKAAFPEIGQTGAAVVGKGKPPYTGGTKIPPTNVEINRPH